MTIEELEELLCKSDLELAKVLQKDRATVFRWRKSGKLQQILAESVANDVAEPESVATEPATVESEVLQESSEKHGDYRLCDNCGSITDNLGKHATKDEGKEVMWCASCYTIVKKEPVTDELKAEIAENSERQDREVTEYRKKNFKPNEKPF